MQGTEALVIYDIDQEDFGEIRSLRIAQIFRREMHVFRYLRPPFIDLCIQLMYGCDARFGRQVGILDQCIDR